MSRPPARHSRSSHRKRRHALRVPLIVVVAITASAACVATLRVVTGARCTVSALLVPSCGAWWGMYLPTTSDAVLVPAVRSRERALGRPLGIIERYHDMSLTADGIFPGAQERQLAAHHLFLFSWAPNVWSAGVRYQWRQVASGELDRSVIIPEASRLKAFHHRFFLTFAAEADGVVPAAGTPADFVAAWRHVHDVFARMGVRNAIWTWVTEGYLPHARTIAALYPGSAYVDWIAYDPYNYFTCHGASWQSFTQTVTPFYRWLTARGLASKPIMLAEYGSVADPNDPARQADWYRSIVPALWGLPHIKALIQWNAAVDGCDLRLTSASAAGRAYRATGLSAYFPKEVP